MPPPKKSARQGKRPQSSFPPPPAHLPHRPRANPPNPNLPSSLASNPPSTCTKNSAPALSPALRIGLLHGRLDADDKEVIMRCYQRGEIDVLVATTVIEVGIDVPNATVMVVEHAERFGLRAAPSAFGGRVGRGAAKSYCILVTGKRVSAEAEERLDAMVRTQDGFELAEARPLHARSRRILRHPSGRLARNSALPT